MEPIPTKSLHCNLFSSLEKSVTGFGSVGQSLSHDLRRLLLLLLVACYLPILLLWSGIIPFAYRFHILLLVLVSLFVFSRWRGHSRRELGITLENGWPALRWNLVFSLFGAAVLYLAWWADVFIQRGHGYSLSHFLFYIVFLGPVQEFIFRGVLFAEMRRCRSLDPLLMLLISTVSFGFLHVIYHHPLLLLITLVSGLAWGISFLRWPTLIGVSLSHSLLGALAMFLGLL
jgi:hypothetical protein